MVYEWIIQAPDKVFSNLDTTTPCSPCMKLIFQTSLVTKNISCILARTWCESCFEQTHTWDPCRKFWEKRSQTQGKRTFCLQVWTAAGGPGEFGNVDGDLRSAARFDQPHSVAVSPDARWAPRWHSSHIPNDVLILEGKIRIIVLAREKKNKKKRTHMRFERAYALNAIFYVELSGWTFMMWRYFNRSTWHTTATTLPPHCNNCHTHCNNCVYGWEFTCKSYSNLSVEHATATHLLHRNLLQKYHKYMRVCVCVSVSVCVCVCVSRVYGRRWAFVGHIHTHT